MRVPFVSVFVSLFVTLLFVVACSKKIDPSKITTTTTVEKPELRMTLDGAWHEVPTEHGYELRNADRSRQVIATVLATEPTAPADRRANLEKLVAIRRDVMGTLSDGGATTSDVAYETNGDRVVARFHGLDAMHDAYAAFLLVATPTAVVTVAYYEYDHANERDAEARAQTLFALVVAK